MADWKVNLQPASFRNIDFEVPSHSIAGGRRKAIHIFPGRDGVYIQDLGKKNQNFSIDAYVFGDDYFTARNALLDALNEEGVGKLVHPYYGIRFVEVLDFEVSETFTEGRMARFTISFLQSENPDFSNQKILPTASIISVRESIIASVYDRFIEAYSIAKKPFTVIAKTKETIGAAIDSIENAKKLYNTVPEFQNLVLETASDIDNLTRDSASLGVATIDLITFGTLPSDEIQPLTNTSAKALFYTLSNLFEFGNQSGNDSDPSVQMDRLVGDIALVTAAGLLTGMTYLSFTEARGFQDALTQRIDTIRQRGYVSTDQYAQWQDLKVAINSDVEERAGSNFRIQTIELDSSLPALALSYDLYGNVDQEEDLITRNGIVDPGFLPGKVPLEVLLG